ncbi:MULTISPECIES: TetR/AcrR family transcriptional regulator [Micromonospora]|nr:MULTISPECIES: TetR/AcrR family transcriptional regulator [Micromonospora]RUL90361.1 TetR/AcrR family transcriptional regulator [Verrucosispora sp. FIM060022]GIJ18832.1 TetR family transcriptional regulator [Micromonospora gifhornensis]
MTTERADAARNRAMILRATEDLLTYREAMPISVDSIAARAGVGKGTVFRRFGSRSGLFRELLAERATRIGEQISHGPPPLGPGAPPGDRLLAFLDALADLAATNATLLAAHAMACAAGRHDDPTYRRWHEHLRQLVGQLRPDLDAGYVAHVLLGAFDAELVRRTIADGGVDRLRAAVRALARCLLPPGPERSCRPGP